MSREEQKARTRRRILEAAGRSFRKGGFGGVGVDGLSKEAGVTSGAFYVHFNSKAAAFRESVVVGVSDVARGVQHFQALHGLQWWREFVRFYLGEKRKCDLAESCGLQSLSSEVARADAASREAFTAELQKVAAAVIAVPDAEAPASIDDALMALATLVGAVSLIRATSDAALVKRIAATTERELVDRYKRFAAGTSSRRKGRGGH
jgi:TetR/AcrR family transcriptional repressor of nem operon